MTCLRVRDRLPELAMGLLSGEELQRVERHVEWCAGCRKEAAELQEGAVTLALSLPEADPPPALEERVVATVLAAAGGPARSPRRRGALLLAVAVLGGVLAVGGMGWGLAERQQVETYREQVSRTRSQFSRIVELARRVQAELEGRAKVFQLDLYPGPGQQPRGSALVFAGPRGRATIAVEAVGPVDEKQGPFMVELVDGTGAKLLVGPMDRTSSGAYVLLQELVQDLSRAEAVELSRVVALRILDREGWPVMIGRPEVAASAAPAPAVSSR